MTLMHRWPGLTAIARSAEGAGSGGGDTATSEPAAILFPDDTPDDGGDRTSADDWSDDFRSAPNGRGEGGADRTEYTPDPNRSQDENDRLKAEHDQAKADENGPANQVPVDGKYALAMPQGVEVDQELLDAVGPEFKSLNLTNGQAQKLADSFLKIQQERAVKQSEAWASRVNGWVSEARSARDIGGDKWEGTVSDARRAVDTLGTPGLKNYLNASGGGNHPEMIRLFAKVGHLIKEDNPANDSAHGYGKPADRAHVLFPNDVPKGK